MDVILVDTPPQGPTRWRLGQYHGDVHRAANAGARTPKATWCEAETRDDNDFKRKYAALMSTVYPDRVQFSFDFTIEPELFGPRLRFQHGDTTYTSLRSLLSGAFRDESVLGFPQRSMTWEELEGKILDEDPASDFGAMLVIHGGRETEQDELSHVGCCIQRRLVKKEELGTFTKALALHQCDGDPEKADRLLNERLKIPQTLGGVSFHEDGECISDHYFRFLKRHRKLEGYTISHALVYRHKTYLSPYMSRLLQQRHQYKLANNKVFSDLQKLLCNSFFGFSSLDSGKFSRSVIVLDSTLKRAKRRRRLLAVDTLQHVQILGAVIPPKKKCPQLLVLITHSQKQCRVRNVLQVAGCILSRSKSIFLYALHRLLRNLPQDKVELSYLDTDGALFSSTAPLKDLMRDKKEWDALFENPTSATHQAGLFKIEAESTNLLVRGVKMYYMDNGPEDPRPLKKFKGMTPKMHMFIGKDDFYGLDGPAHLIYTKMRPTKAGQVMIGLEQKSLISSLNVKRKMMVGPRASPVRQPAF